MHLVGYLCKTACTYVNISIEEKLEFLVNSLWILNDTADEIASVAGEVDSVQVIAMQLIMSIAVQSVLRVIAVQFQVYHCSRWSHIEIRID